MGEYYRKKLRFTIGKYINNTKLIHIKKLVLFTLPVLVLGLSSVVIHAYSGIPEEVRIGLYFNDTKTNQYTAVSSFTVDGESGLHISSYTGSELINLLDEPTSNALTIKKDEAYHAKLSGNFASYDDLVSKLEEYKSNGIDAYAAFVDTWQIWSGSSSDENSLKAQLAGITEFTVVPPSSKRIVILSSDNKVKLMYDSLEGALRIYPNEGKSPALFRINGDSKKVYRGGVEVLRQTGSDMTVINVLPMDEYLYGVVPGEIGASSHVEALKAQAVAARTYTINNLSKYKHLNFNLCTTTYSQVYKGYSVEHPATNKAIDDTKGEIVTYNGKPAAVFYFSSSGGKTEDVKNVWGSDGYPYLVSVDDLYESGTSWHYNWQVSYTAQKIGEIMNSRGFNLGNIVGVYITKRSEVGRAIEVVVKGTKDERVYTNSNTRAFLSLDSQWYEITTDSDISVLTEEGSTVNSQLNGKKVLTASGANTINTTGNISILGSNDTKKKVPTVPTTYIFTGKGWGHGVGMSQEGAKGMANAGFTYKEILTHYFTGTEVE